LSNLQLIFTVIYPHKNLEYDLIYHLFVGIILLKYKSLKGEMRMRSMRETLEMQFNFQRIQNGRKRNLIIYTIYLSLFTQPGMQYYLDLFQRAL